VEEEYISTNIQEQGIYSNLYQLSRIKLMSHTMKLWERVIEHRIA
jgi:hypothetical protein